jgi:uncharacterized protein YqjF (DUF2071 family)
MPSIVEPVAADPPPNLRRPVMRQQWNELAYFHWPYEPEVVQRLLPAGVTVDTFDGSAWVGLIPFEMCDVQLGPTPPLPWLGNFIEINVRTYVVDQLGRRAVWFFSLDVPRSVIVAVARSVFALPYCWAHATHVRQGDRHRYQMTRRWPRNPRTAAEMSFTVGDVIPKNDVSELDHFLTARWALITQRRSQLLYGDVRHPRWPLRLVTDVQIDESVIDAAGLPSPVGAPLARYSLGVEVEVAWLQNVTDQETP